jgi:hypothetical protein
VYVDYNEKVIASFLKRVVYKELDIIENFEQIEKSTWFRTKPKEERPMYEYAILAPNLKFALSLIWED